MYRPLVHHRLVEAKVAGWSASPGCGRRWARQAIEVTIVAGSVRLSKDDKVIRVHTIRHDRSRSAPSPTPKAAPAARTPPSDMSASCRNSPVA